MEVDVKDKIPTLQIINTGVFIIIIPGEEMVKKNSFVSLLFIYWFWCFFLTLASIISTGFERSACFEYYHKGAQYWGVFGRQHLAASLCLISIIQ